MKKSAARTLGVAALGAAFAAAAAGSASAVTALPVDAVAGALPVSTSALDTVAKSLPVQETANKVLGGEATDAVAPVTGLLGGLPTKGLSANGIPLGG
ncbi:hypothetical protein PUR28_22930 [Streptomyces sp. BE308]|uniref:hypothetical protein n=1 Tax=unclassified Streptomyces TaxID=2593676 RepID=UPI0022539947|nr:MULTISPECIES: hypothetical protein [unclassified Streptomyces]MCX4674713.1 hypothetical protein [Streptomyces sp. NBC_01433]MEE1793586.1 hypothetical protein [Streptomyces sp. BE308]WRZ74665.1 hypothetical protein OG251_25350 [Streptomyces sp. NBC_01237]